ncbi:MAG TPA: OmpA family protein, partial [Cellvibrionaceae bacterium]
DLIDSGLMQISSNEMWLQIELRDSILFPSGSAEASQQARDIFTEVSALLDDVDHPVQIEGFTDNIPISNERFPSNWELSAARASAIVKWMVEQGLDPSRLSAVGYGEHQPIASNNTLEGRAQNRRVAIMISRHKRDRPVAAPGAFTESTTRSPISTEGLDSATGNATSESQMRTIELDDGNLLFSSDPDLPRVDR